VLDEALETIEHSEQFFNGPQLMATSVSPERVKAYRGAYAHHLAWRHFRPGANNPLGVGPVGSGVFVTDGQGRTLWTRRASGIVDPGTWSLSAAGGVETEAGFRAAALAELGEELGVSEAQLLSLDPLHLFDAPETLGCYVTFSACLRPDTPLSPNPAEIAAYLWGPNPYSLEPRQPHMEMLWEHVRHTAAF
jgi:8-oxo-dGTP pyrophosphatase MutT (NUDIX family)